LISTSQQLENYLKVIKDESKLAIDTEFKRIDTYYPELCLIQIATSNSIECIDVLTIKDLEPLFKKLYDEKTSWVVHSARQDIEALFCLSKRIPISVFDTQIAASLLNFPLQISYQSLTESIQNIYLEKKHTRFDWTIRPLPIDVLKYALDDVRYLFKNYEFLKNELINSNKLVWMEEEADFLLHQSLYEPNFMQIIKKTKGITKINYSFQKDAIDLILWRESIAQQKNKPRKWIMSDDDLIDYVCGKKSLSLKTKKLFDEFSKNIEFEIDTQSTLIANKPLNSDEKNKKKKLQEQIKNLSTEHNIAPELICSSKSLVKFIRGDLSVSINRGWRKKITQNLN